MASTTTFNPFTCLSISYLTRNDVSPLSYIFIATKRVEATTSLKLLVPQRGAVGELKEISLQAWECLDLDL